MYTATNIHYEHSARVRGLETGGIAAMHRLAQATGLVDAIDGQVHVLKVHLPYHESDHVLGLAYNVLCGGTCLQDIELRRQNEAYLDALGAQRVPDPTTAGVDTITLESCVTGDCVNFSGTVELTYDDVTDGVTAGVVLTIDNQTNGDVTLVNLLFGGPVANTLVTLTSGTAASFTNYVPTVVLDGEEMTVQTFSSAYVDAGYSFNVEINLPPPPGDGEARLAPGESITFWIGGVSPANLQGALAHVQSMNPGDDSAKVTVPDGGATLALLGAALVGLGAVRRRISA
jgi:hypothetical protein